jgi:hypothetical protein
MLKKYLLIAFLITVVSYLYSLMIAVLLAPAIKDIYFHFSTGISLSITGCIALYIVHQVNMLINKMIVGASKAIFLLNILVSFLITSILFAFITWLLNVLLRSTWELDFLYLKDQIIIINFLILIILAYYTIAYYTQTTAIKNKKLKADNLELTLALNKYLTRIPSLSNKKTILIPVSDVLYFQIEEGIVFAYTNPNKKHALSITTLNELDSNLNPAVFFRLNRSEIVNIDKITSFEPYFKDRLAIKLSNNETTLYTSNTKSAPFREWLTRPSN